jgi:dTDP-4-dehydrorhamnose reductase
VILNPAAYTAVDKAESEPDLANAVNGIAPGIIGEEARKLAALVLHYSTDYVFDGKKTAPYTEDDDTAPLGTYGATKLAGEGALQSSGARHLIMRTSWVYGTHGANFMKTILRLAKERAELKIVSDQIGSPTSAPLIADVTAHMLSKYRRTDPDSFPQGIYHLTAGGSTSWHGYARLIVQYAVDHGVSLELSPENVKPIPTSEYPMPSPRPANSLLDTSRICKDFDLRLPPWEVGAEFVLERLCQYA